MRSRPCYDAIKLKIALLEYPPGKNFSELELATELAEPRAKIREAIKLLAQDKLVTVFPQRITTISKLDVRTTIDSIFIIKSLLAAIIKDPVPIPAETAVAIAKLEQEIARFEKEDWIKDDDFFEIDHQFYLLICKLKPFQRLTNIIFKEKIHIDRVIRLALNQQEDCRTIIVYYKQVLGGIKSGSKETTLHSLEQLAKTVEDYSLRAEKYYPEYF